MNRLMMHVTDTQTIHNSHHIIDSLDTSTKISLIICLFVYCENYSDINICQTPVRYVSKGLEGGGFCCGIISDILTHSLFAHLMLTLLVPLRGVERQAYSKRTFIPLSYYSQAINSSLIIYKDNEVNCRRSAGPTRTIGARRQQYNANHMMTFRCTFMGNS